MVTVSLVVELDTRYTRVERTRCANHTSLHTRVQLLLLKRHDNVQPPLGARAGGGAELKTGHREGAIDGYRSRRQRRRAQSEPVHASGQHFTRATLAALDSQV